MTTRDDLEKHLWVAITGNRLSGRTHTTDAAIRELSRRFKQPWTVAGVSRETWRRWNLPQGAKNAQKPSPAKQAGLLAALRRLRLSDSREQRIRTTTGIHIKAWDNYELVERDLGSSTLEWSPAQARTFANTLMDRYLVGGISAASKAWMDQMPANGGWAQGWLHPDSHGSSQSMDIRSISLMGDPEHAGRVGRARRR